jgi:hypothetical protein
VITGLGRGQSAFPREACIVINLLRFLGDDALTFLIAYHLLLLGLVILHTSNRRDTSRYDRIS